MQTITITTNTGQKEIEAEVYKGWAIHGPEEDTHITHIPSGRIVVILDSREEARIFCDLAEHQEIDPNATEEQIVKNEDLAMLRGFAITHDLRDGVWNGYLEGRPQPTNPPMPR